MFTSAFCLEAVTAHPPISDDFVLWLSVLSIFLLVAYMFIRTIPRIPLDRRRFGLIATSMGLLTVVLLVSYGLIQVFG